MSSIKENNITQGNLLKAMVRFSVPYLIASFLQALYGMADLFVIGQFNGAAQVSAVSIGSQVMHMVTVVAVGLAMGTTVSISLAIGDKNYKRASLAIGNSIIIFAILALLSTGILILNISNFLSALNTPSEALNDAYNYLLICFIGTPFIIAYNLLSSIYRGLGDTKSPMIYVAISGIVNIGLDFLLIGPMKMGAMGAAIATISAQAVSVVLALIFMRKLGSELKISKEDFKLKAEMVKSILFIGFPIALQDGLIQISFLVITMIANMRGLEVATAVGIVEKVISFLFLIPSAMLSTVSAVAAQNAGAGLHERGRKALKYGIIICVIFGAIVSVICQFAGAQIVSLFVHDEPQVVVYGEQYLRAYCFDCIFAGIHFCFSGYFSAYEKSIYSFIHNIISIILVRIPLSYLASRLFLTTLFPMGMAAPLGSVLSSIICVVFYLIMRKKQLYK